MQRILLTIITLGCLVTAAKPQGVKLRLDSDDVLQASLFTQPNADAIITGINSAGTLKISADRGGLGDFGSWLDNDLILNGGILAFEPISAPKFVGALEFGEVGTGIFGTTGISASIDFKFDGTTRATITATGFSLFAGQFSGNGGGLTNINPGMLTGIGTVPDTAISATFARNDLRVRSLSAMTLAKSVSSIGGVSSGISGAAYNPRSGTLFVIRNVSNSSGNIYELTTDGALIRTITPTNFNDTEAIEYVTSIVAAGTNELFDVFLIGEEDDAAAGSANPGLQRITLCLLKPSDTGLDRLNNNGTNPDNVSVSTAYSGGTIDNGGLESIAYDPKRNFIYYTAEFRTSASANNLAGSDVAKVFQRNITANPTTLALGSESELCDITSLFAGTLTDISDAAYDLQSDTILLLSDQSDKVVRIYRDGFPIEQLSTPATQPEGVALHPDGTALYVVGESQEFYRYQLGIHRGDALLNSRIYPTEASSINVQTGAAYTLLPSDNGKIITINNASATTVTVPTGLPIGFSCRIIQLGTGVLTFTGSGTIVNTFGGTVSLGGQYAAADIQGTAVANTFVMIKHQ